MKGSSLDEKLNPTLVHGEFDEANYILVDGCTPIMTV